MADAREIRRGIVEFIKAKGPSLPVQISRECRINTLFAGAFLSELASEKQIKISSLKVGGSPLYFIEGQEPMLENFYIHLPGKEKEAFLLLKERKILQDRKQEPAIRVALRGIRDFALSFHDDNEMWWRFHSTNEEEASGIFKEIKEKNLAEKREISKKIEKESELTEESALIKEIRQEIIREPAKEVKESPLDIGLKKEPAEPAEEAKKPEARVKRAPFAEQFKKFVENKGWDIVRIEKAGKKDILARLKSGSEEVLAYAMDRKKLSESDLLKAHRKALQLQLPFIILSKGEFPKRIKELFDAYENMRGIEILDS